MSINGNPIKLRGTTYTKGIGTHAVSTIIYNLAGEYTNFLRDVGIDDEEVGKGTGSVDFQVIGDGKVLFDSGVLTNSSAGRQHQRLALPACSTLTLVATNGVAEQHRLRSRRLGRRACSRIRPRPAAPPSVLGDGALDYVRSNSRWTTGRRRTRPASTSIARPTATDVDRRSPRSARM